MSLLPLLVSVALARKPRPEPEPPPPTPAPEFWSDEGLAAAVAKVLPAIETAAGRTYATPPVVEIATAEEFGRVMAEEQALIMGAVQRDTPQELREQQIGSGGLVPGLLGKYAVFDDKLFLCRESIEQAVTEHLKRPAETIPAFATVILVHELVHTLHDQQTDLAEQIRALPDMEGMYANQATAEGLATWVTERAATQLGLEAEAKALEELQGWSDEGLVDKTSWPVWASYGLGRDAMRWHFEHGGLDEVWAVAIHPPTLSSGVYRPETWQAERVPPDLDYAAILKGTERQLTDEEWIVGISLLGEHDLRGEAIFGDNAEALADILAHLRQAWQLDGVRRDRKGQVRVLVFDAPDAAARYLEQLRAQATGQAAAMSEAIGHEVDVVFEPFEDVPADAALLRSSRLRGADGVLSERHVAWVVRGSTIVAVTADRFRPGLRLGWTVEEVYRRLEAARR
ncbi:MAG: hypothetical protein H6738_01680 [Alphaproteobacteria bacterium]|nr:hypothetical protein [Alphaproteobacteria bacterium]MCB9695478.1 hypothetical protein [Alphaproteobacteria bacterium]